MCSVSLKNSRFCLTGTNQARMDSESSRHRAQPSWPAHSQFLGGMSMTTTAHATANAAWRILRPINNILSEGNLPSPSWAPGRLLKHRDRVPMDTGVPRKTLSLCPDCNREAVEAVLKGEIDAADFRDNPGIIEAEILEEGGRILMRKACEKHCPFEDALSNHPDFFRKVQRLAFGRHFHDLDDCNVHAHG